jgi:hypothetical protein
MAVVRAWAMRAGAGVDDQCLAFEVALEEGATTLDSRMLGRCRTPPEVVYLGTGLCLEHRDLLQTSQDRKVYRPQRRGDAMP